MLSIAFRFLSVLFLSVAAFSAWAEEFRVKAGEEAVIRDSSSRLQLDTLILEDGATIRFAPGVTRWQVSASRVVVGDNVTILGSGTAGEPGQPGEDTEGQAEECEDGKPGKPGGGGTRGSKGVVVAMNLKIAEWGSMTIDTSGGAGGDGGKGGEGQQAGEVDKCSRTRGGAGGAGGDGGDGGNGGNLRIRYSYLPGSQLDEALEKKLTIKNQGGSGGAAGEGGAGGKGTDGQYITMRTLTGSRKWIAGGKEGAEGVEGKSGRTGVDGQLLIEEDLAGLLDKKMQQQSAQVDQIRQQLKQELTKETTRIAAQAAAKQQQLEERNAALLQQLQQANTAGAAAGAGQGDLKAQLRELEAGQADQAEKIRSLERQVTELKRLLERTLSE